MVIKDEYNNLAVFQYAISGLISLCWYCSPHCCCTTDGLVTPAAVTCSSDEFTCNSGECVELKYRCDHHYHCPDGSDEFDCRKYTPPNSCHLAPCPTASNKKLSYRRETARQLHMTTWAGQLTF